MTNELEVLRAERDTYKVQAEALRMDAQRYRWWRENIYCIEKNGNGIYGVAYCYKIPMFVGLHPSVTKEPTSAELMDAIADRAIAQGAQP